MRLIIDLGHDYGSGMDDLFASWDAIVTPAHRYDDVATAIEKDQVDLVCFGGGADISTQLYGHRNMFTARPDTMSARDRIEQEIFQLCVRHGVPMLGICRGAQFVCAMSGGALIQDVQNHSGTHKIVTEDGRSLTMTSTHHQMMYPDCAPKFELLAWAPGMPEYIEMYSREALYDRKAVKGDINPSWFLKEPEIVYFPLTNALAVQGHPEYFNNGHETQEYVLKLVNDWMF